MKKRMCPDCFKLLVLRTNSNTGVRFWGCSSYPECRYTVSMIEQDMKDDWWAVRIKYTDKKEIRRIMKDQEGLVQKADEEYYKKYWQRYHQSIPDPDAITWFGGDGRTWGM